MVRAGATLRPETGRSDVSDLHELTADQQLAGIRAGTFSPRELVDHYLDRVERLDGRIGSFITVLGDEARIAAAEAEAVRRTTPAEDLPPLFGLPIAIKDLHPTAGIRTTMGSAAFADFVPAVDGVAVNAIRRAGAILVGKTHAPEFGPCCYTQSELAAEAVTPYDLGRSASGSSGGSAAAVAAGLVGIAHASDGAGSTRTPAANCGLVGYKPSRGRVSPAIPSFASLGIEGPVARTVADAALLLDVMARPAAGDLYPAPDGEPNSFRKAASAQPPRLRVARYRDPGLDAEVHPDCVAAYEKATALLGELGHEIVDIDHPLGTTGMADLLEPMASLFAVGVATTVRTMVPPDRRELLRPLTTYYVARGERTDVIGYALALGQLVSAASATLRAFASYDVVLTPTTTAPPMPCGAFRLDDAEQALAAMWQWTAFTPLASLTGQPAVSLPVHVGGDGLPVGVHLTAQLHRDEVLFSLGAQLEGAVGWQDRHPEVWRS